MKRSLIAATLALALTSTAAEARHHRHARHGYRVPWCGLYMMKLTGKTDPRLALARQWAREGVNAGGPGVDVVVVWPHHVGKIVGQDSAGNWLVHSGNDGNAVRTRARSLRGVIAFRRV